jgi:ribose transport system substrate-binding protein
MKNKRICSILMVVVMCVCILSACKKSVGTPEDNAATTEDTDTEEQEEEEENGVYKFGFSGIDMENPYYITLEAAIRESIEEEGSELVTMDPASDAEQQSEQLKEMVEEGVQVIFLSPVNWEEITPTLQYLKENNITIVNVDTQVKEMDYVDAYVGSDNKEAGYLCGENLIGRRPEGGKVVILECPTQNSINDRISGFEEALAEAEVGFEVVARADTNGEFEKALEAANEILEEHSDVTAIMCGNDQLAVAAKTAVNLAGLNEVLIYGVDGSPDIKKELKKTESQIAGTAAQSPINIGKTAVEIAFKILNGEEYDKVTYEDVFLIDKDNVSMYGVDGWQ